MRANIRLGLVGFGKIARDQHLPAIARTQGIELRAIASPDAATDAMVQYADIDAMLASEPELDAVVLCQPPQARFVAARAAIMAGKHVFLEKPPGATLSEVETLIGLAQSRGVTLFASWHSREAEAVDKAREHLSTATIRQVEITWKEDVRVWHPGQEWIWRPGGFGVFDPGINALSILTAILPDPVRLTGAQLLVPGNRDAPIAASLAMETASGVPVAAEFDFRQTGEQTWDIRVETPRGEVRLSHGGNRLAIDGAAVEVARESEYPRLYRHFVDLVRRGASDVDLAPLRLVADAFLIGRSRITDAFEE